MCVSSTSMMLNNPPETILHVLYDYTSNQEDELTLKFVHHHHHHHRY